MTVWFLNESVINHVSGISVHILDVLVNVVIGQVVSIQVQESGLPKYNYSLSICSQNLTVGSGVTCGQQRAAACQSAASGSVWSLGLLEKQTLRLVVNSFKIAAH